MNEYLDTIFESPLSGSKQNGAISVEDYTEKRRWGLRGKEAARVLREKGWDVPDRPNRLINTKDHTLVMALSQREFWFLDPGNGATLPLSADDAFKKSAYPLFCQHSHAWLVIRGEQKALMMAKLCGVDLSPDTFHTGDVAQTQIALINCIIARHDLGGDDVFSLLFDHSYAEYAHEALLDARLEFL